eukprot:40132-Chlamydomonas_euryale.AAC.1
MVARAQRVADQSVAVHAIAKKRAAGRQARELQDRVKAASLSRGGCVPRRQPRPAGRRTSRDKVSSASRHHACDAWVQAQGAHVRACAPQKLNKRGRRRLSAAANRPHLRLTTKTPKRHWCVLVPRAAIFVPAQNEVVLDHIQHDVELAEEHHAVATLTQLHQQAVKHLRKGSFRVWVGGSAGEGKGTKE